jgi:hypothetical protein
VKEESTEGNLLQPGQEESAATALLALVEKIQSSRMDRSEAMSEIISATNKVPLTGMESWERQLRDKFPPSDEPPARSGWFAWLRRHEETGPALTWLDMISGDGRLREKGLRELSPPAPNAFFLVLAIRRLNDWVPQVRQAARERLPTIVSGSDPAHLHEALSATFDTWTSWERLEHQDNAVLMNMLEVPGVAAVLREKVISTPSGPINQLFGQVGRTPVLDDSLSDISARAVQPWVRAKAYRSQFEGRMVWLTGYRRIYDYMGYATGRHRAMTDERKLSRTFDFEDLMAKASADPSSAVRRIAAEFLIRRLDDPNFDALSWAKRFAADPARSVSERGTFALKTLQERANAGP